MHPAVGLHRAEEGARHSSLLHKLFCAFQPEDLALIDEIAIEIVRAKRNSDRDCEKVLRETDFFKKKMDISIKI